MPDGRGGVPVPADRRADRAAPEQPPTMNQLLAACAAASAVSTPPDAAAQSRTDRQPEPEGPASTKGRDAA
ncbi:hypothetical protein [Streptomyces gilvosporeus]|nr:hypothetical protein [Streptomyces gilvosporeus]